MNRHKGHNYPTEFANMIAKKVIFATARKESSVWVAVAAELLLHNEGSESIQHVANDMSAACTKCVSANLGITWMVCDKFYVIQNVVEVSD
jgi:transposase